jgi:hypothetical protein
MLGLRVLASHRHRADSGHLRPLRAVRFHVGRRMEIQRERAAATTGTGRLRVPRSLAAILTATAGALHARSWICISRSCVALPPADMEATAERPVTAVRAERRATAAPMVLPAMAEVAMLRAEAADTIAEAEVAAIPAAEVAEAIPVGAAAVTAVVGTASPNKLM